MTLESRAPWDFQVYRAPYANPESFESLFEGSETCLPDLLPTRGPILLGNLPRLDPNVQFTDLGWIQEAVPWMSLALRAPAGLERGLLASALTRVAKHGAVVLPHDASVGDAVVALSSSFVPAIDVPRWLMHAAPGWRSRARLSAAEQLCEGFLAYERPELRPADRPSRTKLWAQVGRALHGALVVQASGTSTAEQIRASYHDSRSLDRALRRAFGVGIADVRQTVGWRWLLWRFLCGAGTGKVKGWDQRI
jgi:hypothetical protein